MALEVHTKDFELVLVDNGTGYPLPEAPHVVNIYNPDNRGFAQACNQGANVAEGEFLVFLNVDTEVTEGWLDALLEPFTDPEVGAVGAKLLYPDGRIQHTGVFLFFDRGLLTAKNRNDDHSEETLQAATGACLAVRRSALVEANGFDIGYLNGYEDVDLCLTLRANGWRIAYAPDSIVYHRESATGPERWAAVRNNIDRLQEKWGERWRTLSTC